MVYFAHPLNIYGTKKESLLVEMIRDEFKSEVYNPNSRELTEKYRSMGMKAFTDEVDKCNKLVIYPFEDGTISAGVAKETQHAIDTGKQVYYINPLTFEIFEIRKLSNVLSVNQTREKLKNIPSLPDAVS